jgi:hypothetical protein
MRKVIMRVSAVVVLVTCFLGTFAGSAMAAGHKPVGVGNLTVNPSDIIAVFRPAEQQAVVVFVGRPGQAIQPILFRDSREATAVFDGLWDNNELSKDAGDDDAGRPLTRMLPKGAERRLATLLVNVNRLMAVAWDSEQSVARVYLDKPIAMPLMEPNSGAEVAYLSVPNIRQEGEAVIAAYKTCTYTK